MPARAGLAWMQLNFDVLRKVSACVDDRHFEILAEFVHAGKGHFWRSCETLKIQIRVFILFDVFLPPWGCQHGRHERSRQRNLAAGSEFREFGE